MVPRFLWNVVPLLAIVSVESIERSDPLAFDSAAIQLCSAPKSLARPIPVHRFHKTGHLHGIHPESVALYPGL